MFKDKRALFLDKDGTLIENVPFNVAPDRIRLAPGAAEGLPRLHAAGYKIIVISNQPGVALGYFPEVELLQVKKRIRELLGQLGVPLTDFFYCPHVVQCGCRKPSPGLLFSAAFEHGINLGRSWFVGDILNDVEAGRRAGCGTVLLDNGNETEWEVSPLRRPDFTVPNLAAAAEVILNRSAEVTVS